MATAFCRQATALCPPPPPPRQCGSPLILGGPRVGWGKATSGPPFWGWSTKGGDIRQTFKINPYISQCFGILCKQKKRDIRQSRRARREGTYDKPLKIKPQFLNSWDSLQADKEGHTTKPTSTKGGDIRQNLRARREGTYDKSVDLSSNPTSMKGGTYDKPYEGTYDKPLGLSSNPTSRSQHEARSPGH